jgi:lipopolysaccharide transport system ATP-binding protein
MPTVISVENLSKAYYLGQIGTGTLSRDLQVWWAKTRGKPNPLLRIGETDHGNRDGEEVWALKDINFTVEQGEVLGIIGKNGAGKSTLLKILSRVTAPTSGKVKVKGRIASLLEVGTGFHPELTGRENIYLNGAILGMSRREIDRKFDEIVDFAEVEKFIDTPVKRYSSGMYVRLAFAVAAHLDPEILVVDEVLAVGDAEFQKKCLGKMGEVAKEGRTVLFVSHNMAAIQNLCPSVLVLNSGQIAMEGNVEDAIRYYSGATITKEKLYTSGPVSSIAVRQDGTDLIITFKYKLSFSIDYPGLGFVISDYYGYKVCGTNTRIDNVNFDRRSHSSGKVDIRLTQPKLFNGIYKLSIWFGDNMRDFFIDKDCFEFEVVNMASLQQPAESLNGPVYPICQWNIFDIT